MWTKYETIDHTNKVFITEDLYCTPERGFARAFLLTQLRGFRVYVSIVGPKSKQFKGDFPLAGSQADDVLEAIANIVNSFEE